MGLCLSSRKITIDNTDTDVLKVSQAVIKRLREENKVKGEKPTALDIATQAAIDKALQYWKGRIDKIKSNQDAINQRIQDQYDKTYKELEDYVPKDKKKKGGPAELKKLQAALIKCYKANQKKSLNCANEVDNFNKWFEDKKAEQKSEEKERKAQKAAEQKEQKPDQKGQKPDQKGQKPDQKAQKGKS